MSKEHIVENKRTTGLMFSMYRRLPVLVKRHLISVALLGPAIPVYGGVGRTDREGMPVWVRADCSHRGATILEGVDG